MAYLVSGGWEKAGGEGTDGGGLQHSQHLGDTARCHGVQKPHLVRPEGLLLEVGG